jgi:hypothetical protein
VGSHTQEISYRVPSIDKCWPTSLWPHTRRMVEQVPHRLRRSTKGRSEVAPTRVAISMQRCWGRSSSDDGWCRLLLPCMLFIFGREWWQWGVGSCCFSWVDEGVGGLNCFGRRRYNKFVSKHSLSKKWRRRLANLRILNSPLQMTFG